MKRLALIAFGSLAAAACMSTPGPVVEAGYPTGSLAVAAMERQDWATAERLLTEERQVDRDNPARLVNLGRVYMETGRTAEAIATWRRALAAERHFEVETLDGRMVRTDQLAREALDRYALQTAAR